MKRCTLFLCILFSVYRMDGQIINSKNIFSLSAGKLNFGGPDDIFFPKGIKNSGITFRADYLHSILPWMRVGVEGSFMQPVSPDQDVNSFAQYTINKEHIITAGINATFLLPYEASGWRNRLRLQFGVAPVAVMYLGERTLNINNTVWNKEDQILEGATLTMKGPSTGFGLSITPSIEYYITQRLGLKISANSLLTSLKGDLITEDLIIYSFNFGIFIPLSKDKKLNY